ncbi:hypothetical protein L596_011647 [Steinernema carpocapsae]|uniref:Sphingomyelin synthase-like domain-containing protein n=1 Tax=Steinernema carpocapsae TaxID=34508 RepID=A0A4U5NUY9_STECR|nr:hypothetical protein L596_011647 [Steinernema carpocapsae]
MGETAAQELNSAANTPGTLSSTVSENGKLRQRFSNVSTPNGTVSDSSIASLGHDKEPKTTKYPTETYKMLICIGMFMFALLLNVLAQVFCHDVVSRFPLSDLSFLLIPEAQLWARKVGDITVAVGVGTAVSFLFVFHKHRTIVLKRYFYILAVQFTMRACCLSLTYYPSSYEDGQELCIPPSHNGLDDIWKNAYSMLIEKGLLQIGDTIYCGDLLFSGHTVSVAQSAFFLNHYTPYCLWPLRWFLIILCILGMICLTISRAHYTADVVIAYWIASFLFSFFHAFILVPLNDRRESRAFRRLFLFWTMFELEKNVPAGRLPNRLEWIFSRPHFMVHFVKQLDTPEDSSRLGRAVKFLNRHRLKTHL